MIRSLRGRLASVEASGAVVDVGGVGLLVRASATTLAALPASGEQVALETHLIVREDALDLYGFADRSERELFEALLGVGGVGPRMALAICGVAAPGWGLPRSGWASGQDTFASTLASPTSGSDMFFPGYCRSINCSSTTMC